MGRFLGGRFGSMIPSDVGGGDGVFSSNDQYYRRRQGTWVAVPVSATGGTTSTPGNGYKYHFFTGPGTFSVSETGNTGGTIDYILIAGGGGGGDDDAGGGGAGGMLETLGYSVSATSYPISIGNGGAGGGPGSPGSNGSPSTGFSQTAVGGGGGVKSATQGKPGGSGGGRYNDSNPVGSGVPGQGYPGGINPPSFSSFATGGGGAGGSGTHSGNTGDQPGGDGGIGRAAFSGDTGIPPSYGTDGPTPGRWFAGGGAGGGRTPAASQGGVGGGGSLGSAGTVNTGGGGAGGNGGIPDRTGDSGGSGICIIRYQV